MPPVPLASTKAEHQHWALNRHPVYHTINSLIALIRNTAAYSCDANEGDGAAGNFRLAAWWQDRLEQEKRADNTGSKDRVSMQYSRCQSHATHLILTALLGCAGHNILSMLYCLTVFIRNLGHWLRIQRGVAEWLEKELDFDTTHGQELPPEPDEFTKQLMDYLYQWAAASNQDNRVTQEKLKSLQEFAHMWNCSKQGRPRHKCSALDVPLHQRLM
jgi:hypothetical protein